MQSRYIDYLRTHAQQTPEAPAILAPGRFLLSYRVLLEHIEGIGSTLGSAGYRRSDRIAIVLPNGPEMATCLLAVSAYATSAPLNPAYSQSEFDFYLSDLGAKALIVEAGTDSPAVATARMCGMAVLEITPATEEGAGVFHFAAARRGKARRDELGELDDVAILLHTSGTTSRPKLVPRTHAGIVAHATYNQKAFELSAADRDLNMLPLFHGYGLSSLIASLMCGGSVVCTPGFDATQFFSWTEQFQPTSYAAVPTMHQAIVRLARETRKSHGFRFIRTGSSVTPPVVRADLERVFGAPVIDSYGMTETGLIAVEPLPPRQRKPGSVGLVSDSDVAIMDERGNLLRFEQDGEVVVRGPKVMLGYVENEEANQAAFMSGWFRTGDRGCVDADGFLFLKGRIKELINRGGEKISPQEINEVLLAHPSVAEAFAFGIPHPTLGEDVAAVVVPRSGETPREHDLREFAAASLAPFKVPRRIGIVDEIPRGATGKPQWIALAGQLDIRPGDSERGGFLGPRDSLQSQLVQIWENLLNINPISVRDNFFDLGGDSLLAVQMLDRIQQVCGRELPGSMLFEGATIEHIAATLVRQQEKTAFVPMIQVQSGDSNRNPPFVFLHGDFVTGGYYCLELARGMGLDQPFYALHPHGLDGREVPPTMQEMAADQVRVLRGLQPHGPYFLGGYCNAAQIAYEMACQLHNDGEEVKFLALIHGWAGRACTGCEEEWDPSPWAPTPEELNSADYYERKGQAYHRYGYAVKTYRPSAYPGRVSVFWPQESPLYCDQSLLGWDKVAPEVEVHMIPGEHTTCITKHARETGEMLAASLNAARLELAMSGKPSPAAP